MKQTSKFLSLLGLARKANMASLGYEKSLDTVHRGKCKVIFTASDLSEKTKRGLIFACEEWGIDVIGVKYSIFELTEALGQKTGIVSITDSGFFKRLTQLAKEEAVFQ